VQRQNYGVHSTFEKAQGICSLLRTLYVGGRCLFRLHQFKRDGYAEFNRDRMALMGARVHWREQSNIPGRLLLQNFMGAVGLNVCDPATAIDLEVDDNLTLNFLYKGLLWVLEMLPDMIDQGLPQALLGLLPAHTSAIFRQRWVLHLAECHGLLPEFLCAYTWDTAQDENTKQGSMEI